MILCRVLGNAVSSIMHPVYEGKSVLVVEPISPKGRAIGPSFLSIDSVQAGEGDIVLVSREGNTARQILGTKQDPLHSVIHAIVDFIEGDLGGRTK